MIRRLVLVLMMLAGPALSQQNLFQTAITVDDAAITNYEINQRELLVRFLGATGDVNETARDALIEDRLRRAAGETAGVEPTEDEILTAMNEFAGRADLDAEQLIIRLEAVGIAEETFRDFITAGLIWREIVQGRFGPQSRPTDSEIDSALSLSTARSEVRVLMSEIILPLAPEVEAQARELIARLARDLRTPAEFAAAAREYSAAPTREQGGRLEWLPLGRLPPPLRAEVLTMSPGDITDPVDLGPGIAIFQLRALEETVGAEPETLAVEYVKILLPEASFAETYDAEYDTCDDLYQPAKTLPDNAFERLTQPAAQVPADVAMELAKLDDNETSTALSEGGFPVYLKLCGRTLDLPENEDGETVDQRRATGERLFQQRLASYGESYLEELRADAIIVEN